MGDYLRYNSAIGNTLSELAILVTAREWAQDYEWSLHEPIALKAGIKPEIAAAIADGRRPDGMSADEEIVYDFSTELFRNKRVPARAYDRALRRFGEKGVIDMTSIAGYLLRLSRHGLECVPYAGCERGAGVEAVSGLSDVRFPISGRRKCFGLCRFFLGRDELAVDQDLGDLHRVERRAFAQIVSDAPEGEAVFNRCIFADTRDEGRIFASRFMRRHIAAGLMLIDDETARRLTQNIARFIG
jgi:hypothetical protein